MRQSETKQRCSYLAKSGKGARRSPREAGARLVAQFFGRSTFSVIKLVKLNPKRMHERITDIENEQASDYQITTLTAEIVGAYVGHHSVAMTDLTNLIATVGHQLAGLGQTPAELEEEKPTPAVPIKRSVRHNEIVCLICGKPKKY